MLLLGFAARRDLFRSPPAAIERAIELNGVAAAMTLGAFRHGRRAAIDESARDGAGA